MKMGDTISLRFGPFQCSGVVEEIVTAGARIRVLDDPVLVGFAKLEQAPNGDLLTTHHGQTFIGRAHWHSTPVIDRSK